jgi:nitrite reductase (NADH) small subunit
MTARVALALEAPPESPAPESTRAAARTEPVVVPPEQVHNLGPASRIPPGEGRTFWVQGREIAVFRDRRRQVFASQSWCPHHFGSLSDGSVGYGEVTCPLHGMRFDLRTGAARGHECGTLRTWRIRISRDGDLLLTLPASE